MSKTYDGQKVFESHIDDVKHLFLSFLASMNEVESIGNKSFKVNGVIIRYGRQLDENSPVSYPRMIIQNIPNKEKITYYINEKCYDELCNQITNLDNRLRQHLQLVFQIKMFESLRVSMKMPTILAEHYCSRQKL